MTLLEREQELERGRALERERDGERSARDLRELESRVQALAEQGLVRVRRSPSGHLDLQVVPAIQRAEQRGQSSVTGHDLWIQPSG